MKAAVYTNYGPPEVLKVVEVNQPVLLDEHEDRLLIKVHAASVNPFDYLLRSGYFPARMSEGFTKPKPENQVLGIDVAGTVVAVGKKVTKFKVGDAVFGHCLGSHAEYVRVRENRISKLPKNTSFAEAAAIPCAGLTALQALRDVAPVKQGHKVLIYGASGGIGHFAVQLAKYYGAEVTAVCSTSNLAWVKALGADEMIDYTQEDFAKNGKKYNLILDAVGKRTYSSVKGSLTEDGIYISEHPLTPSGQIFQWIFSMIMKDKKFKTHLSQGNEEDINFMRELVEQGILKAVVEKSYSLNEIVAAHQHSQAGHTKGKIVIDMLKS